MSDRAWEELVDLIDTKYTIDNHTRQAEAIEGQPQFKRQVEAIFFEKDNQKYKIERSESPAVTDSKTHYVHRGAAQRVERSYDPHETVKRVAFFRQQPDGYWNEIQPEAMLG